MKKSTLLWLATLSCYATFAQTKTIKVLDIEKTSAAITIDGVLNEPVWNNLQPITNQINITNNDCGFVAPGIGNNNTASFGAIWNNEVLTIGVQVKDLSLSSGDRIQLYLSMDNNRTSNCPVNWPRSYNFNTFQIEVNPINGTASSPSGQIGNVGAVKVSVIPGGYTAEITLLWSEMDFQSGLQTTIGREIGFDIGIDDEDGQQVNGRTGQLMWNNSGANRNWTEATNFGILKLGTDICQRPSIAGVAKCGATAVTLTPQGGTEYFWYKNNNDATPFFKGNSYTTPVLNASTTYYVANNSLKCLSDKVPVKVTIDLKAPDAVNSNITGTINPCAGYNEFTYYTQNFESETYSWRTTGNIVTTYTNSATITWPYAGAGKVTVFKTNTCGKGPDKSLEVFVQSTPNPKFSISGPTTICPGSISTYEIVGDKDNNYNWSFNNWFSNPQILSKTNTKVTVKWETQGLNYVNANAYNNCGNSPTFALAVNVISRPLNPSICKLTADKTGAMIEVVGNKFYQNYYYPTLDSLPYKYIDSMMVYREGRKANQYSLIGGVNIKNGYNFTDLTARPSQQEYRYKISLKDSCGNVSEMSEVHKTIYLAMNRGFADNIWNLVWTPYLGLYEIPTYDIYRGTSVDKMEFLNSVSGNSTSFTDFDAPKGTSLYYQIKIADINCGNGSDNEIRSNLINYNIVTGMVGNEIVDAGFSVYPNPSAGNFTIESMNASGTITIFNVLGEEIRTGQVDLNNRKLEVNGLAAGIYSVEITKSSVKSRTTIIVQ